MFEESLGERERERERDKDIYAVQLSGYLSSTLIFLKYSENFGCPDSVRMGQNHFLWGDLRGSEYASYLTQCFTHTNMGIFIFFLFCR